MITEVRGNLLTSDCDVIIHQANCFGRMGAGIAKQIVKKYPKVAQVDKDFPIPVGLRERLGNYSVYTAPNGVKVVNMYSQYRWGREKVQTEYPYMKQALKKIVSEVKGDKIGVPYELGCGLAGGDWSIVSEILEEVSTELGKEIHVYKLESIK